ncbi:MAG TPA: single-stranded-DNA-specific exonuclease RecJ [candidate division Zixibacteria bacterium]|nr:single-stranded-DNA-specific exonuclease RecJ [candidate division Zixibacteria bacterium]
MAKHWIVRQVDRDRVDRHCRELGVSPLLARLLLLRGLDDGAEARRYLSSSLRHDLPSPFLMAGMEAAVSRIVRAVEHREPIAIWGDYDVDGTTGAALLVSFLAEIGAECTFHVPHRIEEGYGLNVEGLARLRERGVGLVVSVDCGISCSREIEAAAAMGLDVVVVDHHEICGELPPAVAVIDPHRPDCEFPDKGLCAAGLAFYLAIGLRARLRDAGRFRDGGDPDLRRYLDIVALGTIADMVPLRGVNRTLIRRGLKELGDSARPGIVALKQVAGIAPGEVRAGQVGYQLGPRINAAGRVDYGLKVVELLTTDSSEVALRIARELEAHNQERRKLESEVLKQALAQADAAGGAAERFSLVVGGEGWHPGVLGIVASRVVEKYYRPAVVIGFDRGFGKGSARSIRGFHMVEGFRACGALLEKFGGHEYAGGLTIREENFARFAEAFEESARQRLSPEDLEPPLEIDAEIDFSLIGGGLARDLESLKPFGIGNPEPLLLTRGVEVCDRKPFSGGSRFRLRQSGRFVTAVAFGPDGDACPAPGNSMDLVYRLTENEWSGTATIELKIVDARPA